MTSPSFSIAINGGLEGSFTGAKGLRQGHPMSPHISVLIIQVLSIMSKAGLIEIPFIVIQDQANSLMFS